MNIKSAATTTVGIFLTCVQHPGDVHHPGDVGAAVTDQHAHPGFLVEGAFRKRPFGRGFRMAGLGQQDRGLGGRGPGLDDRFRDVLGGFDPAADKHPRAAGGHRIVEGGPQKTVGRGGDPQAAGQVGKGRRSAGNRWIARPDRTLPRFCGSDGGRRSRSSGCRFPGSRKPGKSGSAGTGPRIRGGPARCIHRTPCPGRVYPENR